MSEHEKIKVKDARYVEMTYEYEGTPKCCMIKFENASPEFTTEWLSDYLNKMLAGEMFMQVDGTDIYTLSAGSIICVAHLFCGNASDGDEPFNEIPTWVKRKSGVNANYLISAGGIDLIEAGTIAEYFTTDETPSVANDSNNILIFDQEEHMPPHVLVIAFISASKMQPNDTDSDEYRNRLTEERETAIRHDIFWQYETVGAATRYVRDYLGYTIYFTGSIAGSILAFDCGITDINPTTFELSCISVSGLYGDREPDFKACVAAKCGCIDAFIDYLQKNIGSDRIITDYETSLLHGSTTYVVVLPSHGTSEEIDRLHDKLMKSDDKLSYLYEMCLSKKAFFITLQEDETATMLNYIYTAAADQPENNILADGTVLSVLSSSECIGVGTEQIWNPIAKSTNGIPLFESIGIRQLNRLVKATTFPEIISIVASDTDISTIGYVKDALAESSFCNIVTCREDIYHRLIQSGIPCEEAFKMMEFARKGLGCYSSKKYKTQLSSFMEEMKRYDVDKHIFRAVQKAPYLTTRAHATVVTLKSLLLAWHKIYNPLCFYQAWVYYHRAEIKDYYVPSNNKDAESWLYIHSSIKCSTNPKEFHYIEMIEEMYLRGINAASLIESVLAEFR